MKKLLLGLSLVISAGAANNLKAQAVEQGNMTLDIYYGFPNLVASLYNSSNTDSEIKMSALGPIGTKFEYMVSDKMGVGIDMNYVNIKWEDTYDNGSGGTYTDKIVYTRMRFMPRFNIHFGSSDSFDGYFGIAAGYGAGKFEYSSTNPNYQTESVPNLFPLAMRLTVGGRYYFTDNIGLHMELGFGGGAIIHGGFAFKF